jgi:hypothetical protein
MRVLLLHPEDSPAQGPWSRERWDLIVDLGRSSQFTERKWSDEQGCPVLRSDGFREGVADARRVRELFSAGGNVLLDEEGIDWWKVMSLRILPEMFTALMLGRLATEIPAGSELWATRVSWQGTVLGGARDLPVRSFGRSGVSRAAAQAMHYARLLRRFPAPQIKQIFLDKYDASYRWRSRFAARPKPLTEPVVLLPSAYENVSRMAAGYARALPEQRFLMITTRWSGRQFSPPANVEIRDLAAYGSEYPRAEIAAVLERWRSLKTDLCSAPELRMLQQAGILESFPEWFGDGLCARNAWREAIEREPVCGVLCGDDSNMYTRLPVLLAARRKIATIDFHHGAFDGNYLIKDLPCEVYLAKNEIERDYLLRVCGLAGDRVMTGAPCSSARAQSPTLTARDRDRGASAVLFSEPYEVAGMRADEVYRELLPPLLEVARKNGRGVIVKLHPFESRAQRTRMVQEILSAEQQKLVTVIDGPLTAELLARTWFGITVESTTVMDCAERGISCFLCGWLAKSPYEYVQQFARFGVGEELQSAEQIEEIPARLAAEGKSARLWRPATVDAAKLQGWLRCGLAEGCVARSVS